MTTAFHEVSFPERIALGASGGPVRRTEIVSLASGHEQRNARWAYSRRRFDAGFGIRSVDDLYAVITFFEARHGRLTGFRFRDPIDHKTCPPGRTISATDQIIATGDGMTASFQLVKTYGENTLARPISKPVPATVSLAVDGVEQVENADFEIDYTSGIVTFTEKAIPASGVLISAGFEFEIPVRFDTDEISTNLVAFKAGQIPSIAIVELLT
jgi:uncharacterized protein (TIGR02217 family)